MLPLSLRPRRCTVANWRPPSDPILRYALLGLSAPPRWISDPLSYAGHRGVQDLAIMLLNHIGFGSAIDRTQIAAVAKQVNRDFKQNDAARYCWTVPAGRGPATRDRNGLDVPAMWGVEALHLELCQDEGRRANRVAPKYAGERRALTKLEAAAWTLFMLLDGATKFGRGSRVVPSSREQLRDAWRQLDDAANAARLPPAWITITYESSAPLPLIHDTDDGSPHAA